MTAITLGYLESTGFEPLTFLGIGDMNFIGRVIHRYYPIRDYGYLGEWKLPIYNNPSEWVQIKLTDTTNFKGNGQSLPNFRKSISIGRLLMPSGMRVLLVIPISSPPYTM